MTFFLFYVKLKNIFKIKKTFKFLRREIAPISRTIFFDIYICQKGQMRLKRTKTALKWILHFFKKTCFLEQKRREFLQKNTAINFVFLLKT
tara:strand:- start:9324 stop:9596 length:273 start_codon:yes stop_codon:yes gene_type:complete